LRFATGSGLPIAARPSARVAHFLSIGALILVAVLIVQPAFGWPPSLPPFGPDNVYALELGAYSDPGTFFGTADQVWRPITYSSLWVQYEISGLDVSAFFSPNIVLWIACAGLIYALVYMHTRLVLAAAAAALITLTDDRMFSPLALIIERQTTLACIFGLLAMLIAYREARRPAANRAWLAAIVALLVLAAISKEFGLAFAFGVAAVGFFNRKRELLVVGLGVFIAYWVARGLVGGLHYGADGASSIGAAGTHSDSGVCETMGFGVNPRDVCYADLTLFEQLAQYAWNVGSSFVAILLYPVIDQSGGYLLAPDVLGSALGGPSNYSGFAFTSLAVPCIITGLAVVAWWKRPRIALPLLVVIVANALLCFQYYRPRLITVGMVALHIAAGIGIAPTLEILKKQVRRLDTRIKAPPRPLRASAPALLVVALLLGSGAAVATRGVALADELEGARGSYEARDPCDAVEVYDITKMPNRIKEKYGLPGRCRAQP
jgi:hypothetical protein